MNWRIYPFLRILLAFSIGILVNRFAELEANFGYLLILFLGLLFSLFWSQYRLDASLVARRSHGFLILISFIGLGYLSAQFHNFSQKPSLDASGLQQATHFTATIISNATTTKRSFKYEALVNQVKVGENWKDFSYNAMLYFVSDSNLSFQYGDRILVKGSFDYFEKQTNPHAFDYSKYMALKGIYLQCFIQAENFVYYQNSPSLSMTKLSYRLGDFLERKLAFFINSKQELDMIKAMLLGRRDEIQPGMQQVYQATGTSHILAVSGLHVGIVFLLFSTIFGWLKNKRLRWLYCLLLLLGIWSFAFITGSSPSVMRASLMLTIVLLAELLKRKSSIYNSIFVSAFILLIYDPNLLFSVSFQLSYLAVLGIVFLYKKIYGLLYLSSRMVNFLWKITALSLSVQIITFPVTIYYFHQFPSIFMITNLLAIPTATVVIVGSFALLLTSSFGAIPYIIAFILEKWVYYYNQSMKIFSELSFANIEGIYFKYYYGFLLLATVVFLIRFLESRELKFMKFFTLSLSLISIIAFVDLRRNSEQKKIIFYDAGAMNCVDIFMGNTCYSNIATPKYSDMADEFSVMPNRKYSMIDETKPLEKLNLSRSIGENTLIRIGGISVLFLEEIESLASSSRDIEIDYLVINKRSSKYLSRIDDYLRYRSLILDSSISRGSATKIKSIFQNTPPIHSISKEGAYVISI